MRILIELVRSRHRREGSERPPAPFRAALPGLLSALLASEAGIAFALAWARVAAIASALCLVALVQAVRAAATLARRRRLADEWLLWGADPRESSALLSWRAGELCSPRTRTMLARGLRRIERELRPGAALGPVPLNKPALRPHLGLLRALAGRLGDVDRPAPMRGILLAERLLTDSGSPCYTAVSDEVVGDALQEILAALDSLSEHAA